VMGWVAMACVALESRTDERGRIRVKVLPGQRSCLPKHDFEAPYEGQLDKETGMVRAVRRMEVQTLQRTKKWP